MLLPYTLVIRIYSIIHPSAYVPSSQDGYLSELFLAPLTSGLVQSLIACLLIFVQAVYINRIVIKHRLLNSFTLLPGLFYILLTSFLPSFLELSPILIGNTFLIMAFSQVSKTYKKPKATSHIFNTGFYIGVSSLIYTPAIIFYLAGWIGLLIMRSFKKIDKIQLLSGTLTPYFLVGSWLFYRENLKEGLLHDLSSSFDLFSSFDAISNGNIIVVATVVLIAIVFVLNYNKFTVKKSIQAQKKIDLLYWIQFSALLGLIIAANIPESYLLYLSLPFAVFISIIFLSLKSKIVAELLHVALLAVMGLIHFGILLLH